MLTEKIYYIIGNSYKKFSSMEEAISYDEVIREAKKQNNRLSKVFLVLGQGLNLTEKRKLKLLERQGRLGFIINRHYKLAPQELSHKTKSHNTMISEPLLIEKGKAYTSYLLLDDDCAEMSDHITGMHIQGMVLTEAARQMMLAVCEKFILPQNLKGNAYFALRKVSSVYHQFAFPIDTNLIHKVNKVKIRKDTCIVETTTLFEQNEEVISEVEINYVASNKNTLSIKESKMAKSALDRSIENNLLKSRVEMCA